MTPGWVDLHTHVYWGVAPLGVEADAHRLRRGVTTAVDAGSSRASTFAGFKRYVIDVSASRVVAMLHLSEIGVMRDDTFGDDAIGELEDLSTLTSVTAPVASPGPVARTGLEQGLAPDTISSDIHAWNIGGPVFDLATTASKFLHLGLPMMDVIRRVTTTPAACIGRAGELGTLAPGAAADLSLLRSVEDEFRIHDSYGGEETTGSVLQPVIVLRNGHRFDCN